MPVTSILVIDIRESEKRTLDRSVLSIWKNQDRCCAVRSKALVDRAAEVLCKRFKDLESSPGIGICFAHAVVRDPAFDERQRRQQFDANQASADTERVTFCICDQFRHNQTE